MHETNHENLYKLVKIKSIMGVKMTRYNLDKQTTEMVNIIHSKTNLPKSIIVRHSIWFVQLVSKEFNINISEIVRNPELAVFKIKSMIQNNQTTTQHQVTTQQTSTSTPQNAPSFIQDNPWIQAIRQRYGR